MHPGESVYLQSDLPLQRPQTCSRNELVRLKNGQHMSLYISDARPQYSTLPPSCDTYIYPQSFHARITPFERARVDLWASRMGVRIIAVDQPGVSLYGSRSIPKHHEPSAPPRGNRYHAIAMAQAVQQVVDLGDQPSVGFIGYSLGAWTVSAMIPAVLSAVSPLTWRIGPVFLIDPANLMPRSIFKLSYALYNNQKHAFSYVAHNRDLPWPVPLPYFSELRELLRILRVDIRQFRWLTQPAFSMAKHTIGDDLHRLDELLATDVRARERAESMRVVLARFSGSTLCTTEHCEQFIQQLSQTCFAERMSCICFASHTPDPALVHASLYSLPIAAGVADYMRTFSAL